ncbi:MAG: diphthine--ammonia ligase [Deltaproteobacteria bacterium]|nr:diphthine--ammonia ligase [Deltaproteobacteria bacterium]
MSLKRILLSWSGGKDSAMALYEIQKTKGYEIVALLTTVTDGYGRVSMHGVREELLERQAESLGLCLHKILIPQKAVNEKYEAIMKEVLTTYKNEDVHSVAFGDIFLEDLKKYREENLAEMGMEGIFPIWKRDSRELVGTFIDLGFRAITTCVDSKVLDSSFVGREIDDDFLRHLPQHVDPCGENGEHHSFVYSGSTFREEIAFTVGEIVLRDSFYFCDLLPSR